MTLLDQLRRDGRLTAAQRIVGLEILTAAAETETGTLLATLEELANRLGMEPSTISTSTGKLQALGYFEKRTAGRRVEYVTRR